MFWVTFVIGVSAAYMLGSAMGYDECDKDRQKSREVVGRWWKQASSSSED